MNNLNINNDSHMNMIDIFKNIYNNCIDDLKKLGCFNIDQSYTGNEVEELFNFFKTPLILRMTENGSIFSHSFDKAAKKIPFASSSSPSPSYACDNEKQDEKKEWDPGEPCSSRTLLNSKNDNNGVDIDEILGENDGYLTENDSDATIDDEQKFTVNSSLKKSKTNAEKAKSQEDCDRIYIPKLNHESKIINNDGDEETDELAVKIDVDEPSESKIEASTQIEISHTENNEQCDNIDLNEISCILNEKDEIPQNTNTEILSMDDLFYNENHQLENEQQNNDSVEKPESNQDETIFHSIHEAQNGNKTRSLESKRVDQILKDTNSLYSSDDDADENLLNKKKHTNFNHESSNNNEIAENANIEQNGDEVISEPSSVDNDINMKAKIKKKKNKILSSDDDDDSNEGYSPGSNDEKSLESNDRDSDLSSEKSKNRKRKRRTRIRVRLDSSTDNDDDDDDENYQKKDVNQTRKKIRKIFDDKKLRAETKDAEKAERERRKRIEEKQKLYNSINIESNEDPIQNENKKCSRLILDIDNKTKEILVEVDKKYLDILKPHQIEGIEFLFNSTIESVERLQKFDHESGCILAHSMGLGKTLQVIIFLHTIMTNKHINDKIRTVLIIVPLNVAKNWRSEFDKWIGFNNSISIYEMTMAKNILERIELMQRWKRKGGIIIMTITLFSQLICGRKLSKLVKKKHNSIIRECLIDPGPDIVIVDEGHLLKNDRTRFNSSISQIRTLRRIILTGTPLQNNLSEYYVMVDFVKPNLLGTKREFKNRFENPINNGQHIDSTDNDVQFMKRRVHVLHQKLKNVIHRHDYNILIPYLKPKYEFVITIKLSKVQADLYKNYLENVATTNSGKNLLNDFNNLRYVWNHPASLIEQSKQRTEKSDDDSLKDFIVSDDDDDDIQCVYDNYEAIHKTKRLKNDEPQTNQVETQNGMNDDDRKFNWWKDVLKNYDDDNYYENYYNIELSTKFLLLFSLIEECEKIGDKIILFSQSLANLDMIEILLGKKNAETNEKYGSKISYEELVEKNGGVSNRWLPEIDYFRIDGKVNSLCRSNIIRNFNDEDDHRSRLMLISTRAGSLGINLIGANRCIIFDVSWNPTHDLQAIYRIFRYGQSKPVYIYRFISYGTMEQKIYDRQIIKQSMSLRVIDEHQITRYFKQSELSELYRFIGDPPESAYKVPPVEAKKDRLICDLYDKFKNLIISIHQHDSLLENRPEENLTEEERRAAWEEFQRESEIQENPSAFINNHLPNTVLSRIFASISDKTAALPNLSEKPNTNVQQNNEHSLLSANLNNESINQYYHNQYPKVPKPIQRQDFISSPSSSYNSNSNNVNNQFNDETIHNYFHQIIRFFQQNPVKNDQKYKGATIESLRKEFSQNIIGKMTVTEDEFRVKLFIYINAIHLVLFSNSRQKSSKILHEIVHNMLKIKTEYIQKYRLQHIDATLKGIIRNRSVNASNQHPQPQKPPIPSSTFGEPQKKIECIELDSD